MQHEGGNKGTPSCPYVQFSCPQRTGVFAFLDDIYLLAKPGRVRYVTLFTTAGIQLRTGKTRTWNRDWPS